MSRKVNPEIFKLSRTGGWRSKYFEKKTGLGSFYSIKDLEIREFTYQFFKKIGLTLFSCKVGYLSNKLNIYVTCIQNKTKLVDSFSLYSGKNCKNYRNKSLNKVGKKKLNNRKMRTLKKILFRTTISYISSKKLLLKKNVQLLENENKYKHFNTALSLKIKTVVNAVTETIRSNSAINRHKVKIGTNLAGKLKAWLGNFEIRQITLKCLLGLKINEYISNNSFHRYSVVKKQLSYNYLFLDILFKSLFTFVSCNRYATLIIQILNKKITKYKPKYKKRLLKAKLVQLKRYRKNAFFNTGLNIAFLMASKKEAAKPLAYYIAANLKNFKKHKALLKFVKTSVKLFSIRKRSNIKALKIKLKGRINGADRARSFELKIGNRISLIKIGSRINYSESTVFTPDGTLSVKVWISYKRRATQLKLKVNRNKKVHENKSSGYKI